MTSPIRHLTEAGFLGKFYIDGEWRKPTGSATAVVVNPATEQPIAEVALGNNEDVDRAVSAAERAFAGWSCKPAAERAALLDRIHGLILERLELFAQALTSEMGAALTYARRAQVPLAANISASRVTISRPILSSAPRQHRHHARGHRRLRPHHPLELASLPDHSQGRSGARGGLHGGVEAERIVAPERLAVRRGDGRCRVPHGVFNLVDGTGPIVGPVWRHIRRWT